MIRNRHVPPGERHRSPGEPPDAARSPVARRTYRAASGATLVVREPDPWPGTALLSPVGEFDVDTVPCLRDALADARREGAETTLVELARVAFGDSSFLHELLAARRAGQRLVLVEPIPAPLRHVFALTGALPLFAVVQDRTRPGPRRTSRRGEESAVEAFELTEVALVSDELGHFTVPLDGPGADVPYALPEGAVLSVALTFRLGEDIDGLAVEETRTREGEVLATRHTPLGGFRAGGPYEIRLPAEHLPVGRAHCGTYEVSGRITDTAGRALASLHHRFTVVHEPYETPAAGQDPLTA